jgi:hypothetical protein
MLAERAPLLSTVERWLRRFKQGNTLCEDAERPGRLRIVIADILLKFPSKDTFASAEIMTGHSGVSALTVKKS